MNELIGPGFPGGEAYQWVRLADNLIANRAFQKRAVVETDPALLGGIKPCLANKLVELEKTVELAKRILIQTEVEAVVPGVHTLQASGGKTFKEEVQDVAFDFLGSNPAL